jgi:predicted CXXCH cytochrome family protein
MAFANFGPHGAYTSDTDACAACHRAHTSFSKLGWTDQQGANRASALLISDANTMSQFCYSCHGDAAPGASTNVVSGIFDAGPTSGLGTPSSGSPSTHAFSSNSSYDATLNGGGFSFMGGHTVSSVGNPAEPVMSSHNMDGAGNYVGSLIKWGNSTTAMTSFTCTDCHDPHGSSNYRLLKDSVNSVTVGGYSTAGVPNAYVISNEEGFPTGGFKKGADGVADGALYKPNYTNAEYAKNPGRSMSAWCASCHTGYNNAGSVTNYGSLLNIGTGTDSAGTAYSDSGNTAIVYHRHKVDVPLVANFGSATARALTVPVLDDKGMPLEMGVGQNLNQANHTLQSWDENGNISCLTCHRAHGTEATMSGWAVATLVGGKASLLTPSGNNALADAANPHGVAPNFSAALLRYDNRGVCERCHNK